MFTLTATIGMTGTISRGEGRNGGCGESTISANVSAFYSTGERFVFTLTASIGMAGAVSGGEG